MGRILSPPRIWGAGLNSEKTEALHTELNERAETATNSYSATVIFCNIFTCAFTCG